MSCSLKSEEDSVFTPPLASLPLVLTYELVLVTGEAGVGVLVGQEMTAVDVKLAFNRVRTAGEVVEVVFGGAPPLEDVRVDMFGLLLLGCVVGLIERVGCVGSVFTLVGGGCCVTVSEGGLTLGTGCGPR